MMLVFSYHKEVFVFCYATCKYII